jgi:hypothetical protein
LCLRMETMEQLHMIFISNSEASLEIKAIARNIS